MKIWLGFGSEHSANLIMIGRFTTPEDAEVASRQLKALHGLISEQFDYDRFDENPMSLYADGPLREMLTKLELPHFSPEDIEHIARGYSSERSGAQIEIRTEEDDVNGFLKFMIGKGALVEVYSAYDFSDGPPVPG